MYNEDFFNYFFSHKEIKYINIILTNKYLTDDEKKVIFDIAIFLKTTCTWHDSLDLLFNFCEDESNITAPRFYELLDNMQALINDANSDEEKEEVYYRITTILCATESELGLSSEDYFDLLNKILEGPKYKNLSESRFDHNKLRLIEEIFKNNPIKGNPERTKLAIETALNNRVDIMTMNSNLYPNVFSIMRDNDILSLDDEYYERALKIAYINIQSYVLDTALHKEGLSIGKKEAIIDYYYEVLDRCLTKYMFCDESKIKEHLQTPLFNIVYNPKFLEMDDKAYRNYLNVIIISGKPFSMAKVLASTNITKEQEDIAIRLINEGPGDSLERDGFDYKQKVALAAISPILTKQSPEEYERILKLVNAYCDKAEKYLNERKYDKNSLMSKMAKGITELLNSEDLYGDNYQKLLSVIDKLTSLESYLYVDYIVDFATNPNSAYYSDYEFNRIIDLIISSDHSYRLVQLFTNDNIPFMESKLNLFEVAARNNETEIAKRTKMLQEQGLYNRNKHAILANVSPELLAKLEIKKPVKIRKLSK